MYEACGTYVITHNGTNCTQIWAMYAIMAARMSPLNGSNSSEDQVNPDSGSKMESKFRMVVELYIISLLAAFGLVGNVLAVIVLRQDRERRDALFLLQAVAVADAFYLIVGVLRYPLRYLISSAADGSNRWVDMQPVVFPLLKTFQVGYAVRIARVSDASMYRKYQYLESYRIGRLNIDFFDISSCPVFFLRVDCIFLDSNASN